MTEPRFPYSEEILQQVWKAMRFNRKELKTACGKTVQVIHPGVQNVSDGPDFLDSRLVIGGITWAGAVEMHLNAAGWNQHGHHKDPYYNNVVLHVIAGGPEKQVRCANGTRPFTLNLQPHLPAGLSRFVKQLHTRKRHNNEHAGFRFISQQAFEEQLARAHMNYLEKKVNDFFEFFDPEKLPQQAWKEALFISLFDGFGIANNRRPMQQLARMLLHETKKTGHEELVRLALNKAFSPESKLVWKYKNGRPASMPEKRIAQAAAFGRLVLEMPFSEVLRPGVSGYWQAWCSQLGFNNTGRINLLYGVVFLPAVYAAASLAGHSRLQTLIFEEWRNLKSPVPQSLLQPFKALPVSPDIYKNKLGAVHLARSLGR